MINLSRRDLVTLGVVALLMIALGFAIGTAVTPTAKLPQNCTAGQILSWDGGAWTCAGTVVVDNTGNVGIGTTTPRGHFDVDGAGDIWLTDDGLQSGSQSLYLPGHIYMAPFGNGDVVYLQARRSDNSGTTALQLRTYDNGSLKDAVHIAGDGYVGIGTTEPGTKLDVQGDTNLGGALDVKGAATLQDALTVDGNVGIGTTRPGAKLTVQTPDDYRGDTLRFESRKAPSYYFLNLKTHVTPNVVRWVFDQQNLWTHYDSVLAFDRGNVGIGTTSPGAKLEVSGGNTILEQEAWQTPTLLNGWQDYGDPYNSVGYFKDSQGIVHLRGMVKGGSVGKAIFTLPPEYSPGHRELMVVCTIPDLAGRVDIDTNGDVLALVVSPEWFSLDGITFRAP